MTDMHLIEQNEEVFYTLDGLVNVSVKDVAFLKERAEANHRKRARLCAHPNEQDQLHEMLIVHSKGSYVPPHKHLSKVESFHIIEGKLRLISFDDDGEIIEVTTMGDLASGLTFYFRQSQHSFHTIIPLSKFVVFHETTNGPFRRDDMILPTWAPDECQVELQKIYSRNLNSRLKKGWL